MTAIRLRFELETEVDDKAISKLLELTERYCVVAQTLIATPAAGHELDAPVAKSGGTPC